MTLGFDFYFIQIIRLSLCAKILCYFDMELNLQTIFREIDDGFSHLEYGVSHSFWPSLILF